MAESTLSMTYSRLLTRVGDFLGLGRDSTAWSSDELARVEDYIRSGYRKFLFPATLGAQFSHEWSFLNPMDSVTTTADDHDYDMEDDFGGIDGNLTFDPEDGYNDVIRIGEGQIRSMRQPGDTTGRPQFAAIRWKASDQSDGQRAELLFWPTPDAAYVIHFAKNVLINELSASYPYPLGGMLHSETILELCLAAAEITADDEQGIHHAAALTLLQASIAQDKTKSTPDYLGYNADHSDSSDRARISRVGMVTINDVEVD